MSNVVLVTANGEQHGLINSLPNSCKDKGEPSMKPETKAEFDKLKKEESRTVKARYINYRGNNERLTKPYMRYAGDPIKIFHLIPGYTYDLPLGFIKEVNGNPGLAQRADQLVGGSLNGEGGQIRAKDAAPIKLHELVPVGF